MSLFGNSGCMECNHVYEFKSDLMLTCAELEECRLEKALSVNVGAMVACIF